MTNQNEAVIFDLSARRFYDIDVGEREVCPSPVTEDPAFRPVGAVGSRVGSGVCSLECYYSRKPYSGEVPYVQADAGTYVPVVDESGAISVLERATGRLIVKAGYLPCPNTFLGGDSSKPWDVLDYDARAIVTHPGGEYAGLMAASLSRGGVPIAVALFDRDGRLVQEAGGDSFHPLTSLTSKYLIESLHPPVLTLASFFMAYRFDAGATYRSLFLMPNSFVALQRDRETSGFSQSLWALVFLTPAVLISGLLSWRVVRDAKRLGLSRWANGLWLATTLAFGLPAYVTYRLTRPTAVLTLCRECGHHRRVDRDVCHYCGGGWNTPALDAPAWRVITS